MRALIIGSRERYEKFMPESEFVRQLEKVYVPRGTPDGEIPPEGLQAEFLAADAISEVSAGLIGSMPKLRLIHSEGVGYNGIDLLAAREKGVYVCNCKGVNATAVAEQAVLLMLGLLRGVVAGHAAELAGRQMQTKEKRMVEGITELGECRVGLVGFGDIGKATARLLRPFGCELFYHTKTAKSALTEAEYAARWLPLDELVETSDIVSLHVPVTEETAGMVDAAFLKKMKPTALLINTARGELVDNEALAAALTDGTIAGAGIDTLAPEPVLPDNPLLRLPPESAERVLFSPHLGGITTATFRRAHRCLWQAMETVAAGGRPENIVNGL